MLNIDYVKRQDHQRRWATENFGNCELGDARRTARLVETAALIYNNPTAHLAALNGQWKDSKAAYRLFANKHVTFEAVVETHCKNTKLAIGGKHSLILCDTSEVIFGKNREIDGAADLGRGGGPGFLLHPGLAVDADTQEIRGIAGAIMRHRQRAPKKETASQRKKRQRESTIWGDLVDQIGLPCDGARYTTVCDRGADSYEILCHMQSNQHNYVVRVCQRQRKVTTPDGEKVKLAEYMEQQEIVGNYELSLRSRKSNKGQKTKSRTARMEVRIGKIVLSAPVHKSRYEKDCGIEKIETYVVWAREVDCPKGEKPLDWMLYTSHEVTTFEEALQVIEWYEQRWLIEEFFKALKTGCRMEDRQLHSSDGLEALCGVLCVTACRLLQMKREALANPDRPAEEIVPPLLVAMLQVAMGSQKRHVKTAYGFYHTLARLGGFLGRRSDGNPGWQSIWQGWDKLTNMVRGAELLAELQKQKCG